MDEPGNILFYSAIRVALAGIVAFGLFRLITVKGKAFKPSHYGRKWTAWIVSISSITILPKFFRHLDANSFAEWVAVTILLGILAFIAGLIYGKIVGRRKEALPKMREDQTGADSIPSINMTHVSENDVLSKTTQEQDKLDQKSMDMNVESPAVTIAKQTIPKAELHEDDIYAQAWDEINDQNRTPNKATWAKAFSISQGDEKKTQAKYIELQVAQLQEEQTARLLQLKAEQEQARRAEEKAKAEEEEKARVEAEKRNVEKKANDELQALARKIESDRYITDSRDLIEKLGGSLQEDKIKWLSRIIVVTLWGETHKFSNIPHFISWVRKDIVPRVLDSCEKEKKNVT